ncbi:50S ribosomal protein L11 methyltransferase [Rhodovibrionaceae bacterium A322]
MSADPIYVVTLKVSEDLADAYEAALESLGGALAMGLPDSQRRVKFQLYLGDEPSHQEVATLLAVAAKSTGSQEPDFSCELMPEMDWVAESQAALPPMQAGRFYVYGSHVTDAPPAASIPLRIDANVAFGTGRHETTRCCLLALGDLGKRYEAARVLDLGCGSGILALAAACLWRKARIVGSDLDGPSVRQALVNAKINHMPHRLQAVESIGYASARLGKEGPYDVILANILAKPLCDMATDTARHLAPKGKAILSGLLTNQEQEVLARHRNAGLVLERRYRLGDWSALVLRKA